MKSAPQSPRCRNALTNWSINFWRIKCSCVPWRTRLPHGLSRYSIMEHCLGHHICVTAVVPNLSGSRCHSTYPWNSLNYTWPLRRPTPYCSYTMCYITSHTSLDFVINSFSKKWETSESYLTRIIWITAAIDIFDLNLPSVANWIIVLWV